MHTRSPAPPAHPSRRALAALALGLSLASSCATPPKPRIVYPPPPDKARVVHLRTFQRPDDLQTGLLSRIGRAILPHDSSLAIYNPAGLALSPDGKTLYVATPPRGRVIAIDRASGSFRSIGTSGDHPLARPIGVATDAEGRLYVSDKDANCVAVYDAAGNYLRQFGKEKLIQPTGLAVDRKGQIAYVISDATTRGGRHVVEAFSLAGAHLRTFGGVRTNELGSFNFPSDVAVSPAGELYVADMLNFRVQVFASGGGLEKTFGQQGAGAVGMYDKMHGIAFDTFKNVYVVDLMQGVHLLNEQFQPLMLFGQGVLGSPIGIAIDGQNHIFVSDFFNHSVHEFQLVNTSAEDSYRPSDPDGAPEKPASSPPAP